MCCRTPGILPLLVSILLLVSGVFVSALADVAGYTTKNVEGRVVYVEEVALSQHATETNNALELLRIKLQEIDLMNMNEDAKANLRSVVFFMDWQRVNNGAAVYHPDVSWLSQNGWLTHKEQTVNITNIRNFINWTTVNQPYMLLHELSHVFHHQVLGFNHPDIIDAYESAIQSGKYDKVAYSSGFNSNAKKKAYATTNAKEYFAELTEAYFGTNDFYPFNRNDLKLHDPMGYSVVEKIWRGATPAIVDHGMPVSEETIFDENRFYRLSNQSIGASKSLDVINDGKNNLLQLASTGQYSGQYWKIEKTANSFYRLTNQWQGRDKSLDIVNDHLDNKVQLADTGNYSGQLWRIAKLENGSYRLTTQFQGAGKSLGVDDRGNSIRLQLFSSRDNPGQYWQITEVE